MDARAARQSRSDLEPVLRTKDDTKQTHILSPFVKSSDLGLEL